MTAPTPRLSTRTVTRLLLSVVALAADPAQAIETRNEGFFVGFVLAGGTAAGATTFSRKDDRQNAPAYSAGLGELEFGTRTASGWGLALTGQSLSFSRVTRDAKSNPQQWDAGALGLTGSWQYQRLTLTAGLLAGSLSDRRSASDVNDYGGSGRSGEHGFFGGKAGLGVSIYRSERLDLKLTGSVENLLLDGSLARDNDLRRHLYVQQAGLALTFYPSAAAGDGSSLAFSTSNCWNCGELMYWSGRALLELGSTVGRVAADGLLQALLHR